MKCPDCKIELWCGNRCCLERSLRNIKFSKNKSLIFYSSDEEQTCANCGLTNHCDWWLDVEIKQHKNNEVTK